ncbi:MAG: hypothetical protein P4L51_02000 [Puia sp.]|nr:hypothetical protein [Puia sp.]
MTISFFQATRRSYPALLILALMFLLGACRKDAEPAGCTGSCQILQVEGTVYDQSTNQPLSGQSISVTLNENPFCLPCSSYRLASGTSDNNGHFLLSYSLDTNRLRDYHIIVSVPLPSNYILFPILKDSFNSKLPQSAYTRNFGSGNMDSMQNLKFGFYPSAPLTVNLHRVSSIVPENPYLFLYVNIDRSKVLSSLSIPQTPANKDTSFVINTSPNLFTKINWNKYSTLTTVLSATDSVKCTPGGNNVLDITY